MTMQAYELHDPSMHYQRQVMKCSQLKQMHNGFARRFGPPISAVRLAPSKLGDTLVVTYTNGQKVEYHIQSIALLKKEKEALAAYIPTMV
jgi:hypothetical protein